MTLTLHCALLINSTRVKLVSSPIIGVSRKFLFESHMAVWIVSRKGGAARAGNRLSFTVFDFSAAAIRVSYANNSSSSDGEGSAESLENGSRG